MLHPKVLFTRGIKETAVIISSVQKAETSIIGHIDIESPLTIHIYRKKFRRENLSQRNERNEATQLQVPCECHLALRDYTETYK